MEREQVVGQKFSTDAGLFNVIQAIVNPKYPVPYKKHSHEQ